MKRSAGRVLASVLLSSVVLWGCSSSKSSTSTTTSTSVATSTSAAPGDQASGLPAVRHVFVINLENKSYGETWGPSSVAPYLSQTLKAQGAFLPSYYAIGHVSLDNYIAEISGQGPSKQTQADCLGAWSDFAVTGVGALGQVLGDGCVYPSSAKTIADQLADQHLTWKGYMEDMSVPCKHPAIGGKDGDVVESAAGGYVTRHDPFVFFHSIIDTSACAGNVVPLSQLAGDLASAATTPNYAMITPNVCNDGHDATCIGGKPGGLVAADAWLRQWVPKITDAPAFKADGMLVITFDEAEATGGDADASSCCNQAKPPNVASASLLPVGPGGGKVGAVVLSPFVKPGTTSTTAYNHYTLLGSIENLFGLPKLGFAGEPGLTYFGSDVFTATH